MVGVECLSITSMHGITVWGTIYRRSSLAVKSVYAASASRLVVHISRGHMDLDGYIPKVTHRI